MCFSANVDRHFYILKSNNVEHHFCPDFQGFFPDFQGFFPGFPQIKTFGSTPCAPASYAIAREEMLLLKHLNFIKLHL